jgi:hypothetical protein
MILAPREIAMVDDVTLRVAIRGFALTLRDAVTEEHYWWVA